MLEIVIMLRLFFALLTSFFKSVKNELKLGI